MKLIEKIVAQEKQELERLRLEQIENDEKFANLIASQLDSPQKSVTPSKKILRSANKQRLCKSKEKVKPVKCKMINTYFQSTSTTQPPAYRLRGEAKRRISCDPNATQSSFQVEDICGNDMAHASKSPDQVNPTEQHENAATKLNFPTKQNEDLSNYRMPLRKRRRLKSV
uniref:Uncharacterized protein n=1 Tax=Ciona savignyi TaxID=51511 RepID=H2YSD5_CIOSA